MSISLKLSNLVSFGLIRKKKVIKNFHNLPPCLIQQTVTAMRLNTRQMLIPAWNKTKYLSKKFKNMGTSYSLISIFIIRTKFVLSGHITKHYRKFETDIHFSA